MKYSQLLNCLAQAGLSPEAAAPYFGVSNMTLRRWQKKKAGEVETAYLPSIYDGIFGMIADGKLSIDTPQVQELIAEKTDGFHHRYSEAVIASLGVSGDFVSGESTETQVLSSLTQIGSSESKREAVESKVNEISHFKKNGKGWGVYIQGLLDVVQSKTLAGPQKYVAYGALFYLLMPFDFIPDHLPIFGLLDDYGVLGLALGFYRESTSITSAK